MISVETSQVKPIERGVACPICFARQHFAPLGLKSGVLRCWNCLNDSVLPCWRGRDDFSYPWDLVADSKPKARYTLKCPKCGNLNPLNDRSRENWGYLDCLGCHERFFTAVLVWDLTSLIDSTRRWVIVKLMEQKHRSYTPHLGAPRTEDFKVYEKDLVGFGRLKSRIVGALKDYESRFEAFKQAQAVYEQQFRENLCAQIAERREQEDFWLLLNGYEFEIEVALLLERRGYKVRRTRGSADNGVDIYIENENGRCAVQCKAHASAVGPAPLRELFGAMNSEGIEKGAFVSLSGFTNGARDFARNKQIELFDVADLIRMSSLEA